mmetsp:Transcript_8662/g.13789  ORF Transcript_8662/g.13789 Transcript_8662/m.13789 type:complete len:85 (-) Transcript_8662:1091-1345(-)
MHSFRVNVYDEEYGDDEQWQQGRNRIECFVENKQANKCKFSNENTGVYHNDEACPDSPSTIRGCWVVVDEVVAIAAFQDDKARQ